MSDPASSAVRKAFDAIDNNNIPQAEIFVENGLKKFPTNHGLQAAEAFVLFRLGKRELALDKATSLALRDDLRDAIAIDALAHVLQGLGGWAALTTLYQRVAQQLPDSLNAQENYFQALIRQGSYTDAQRVALGLHKKHAATNDGKHQSWAVMSMLAQVPADAKDHLQLKLTTRMLSASSLATTEACKAYVDVLFQQELFTEALAFLLSARGEKIGLLERRVENVRLALSALGQPAAAAAAARFLIKLSSDNWKYYTWYLDSFMASNTVVAETDDIVLATDAKAPLSSIPEHNTQGTPVTIPVASAVEQRLEDVIEGLLLPLQQVEIKERPNKKRRSPFLAELEVLRRLAQKSGTSAATLLTRLQRAVVEYCKLFGAKPVCFMDIVPYLTLIGPDGIEEVAQTCKAAAAVEGLPPATSASFRMLECKCRLMLPQIASLDDDAAVMQIETLVAAYRDASALSANLEWSEEGICDGYLSCAVTLALHKFSDSNDNKWLLRALDILRESERTLNNPSWLVLAVQIQRHLGVVNTAMTKQLDFKSVQFDSMRHLGYAPLLEGGAIKDQEKWDSEAYKFYSSLGKETSALRIKVFKFFTWPMWKDLLGFERRLQGSIGRVESIAAFALSNSRACQTQRELFAHVEGIAKDVASVMDVVEGGNDASSPLTCNEDSTVLRAALVDDLHSARCISLAGKLLAPTKPLAERLAAARDNIALFCIVHDHILREAERQRKAAAPRPNKKGASSQDTASAPTLTFLAQRFPPHVNTSWPSPLRPFMPLLTQTLAPGAAIVPAVSSQWPPAIELVVSELLAPTQLGSSDVVDKVDALHKVLMPSSGYFLIALLQGACADVVPVSKIADALKAKCIDAWQLLLKEAADNAATNSRFVDATPLLRDQLVSFHQRKIRELQDLVADLAVCCTAASKRR
jgi:N-terminal acetyltransferase B complex non-catalytic subunit